jgi:hypothetical protein
MAANEKGKVAEFLVLREHHPSPEDYFIYVFPCWGKLWKMKALKQERGSSYLSLICCVQTFYQLGSFFLWFFFFFFFFWDRVSLCSPGYPGTHFVAQAGLELRNPPASASQVLGLKACATTPGNSKLLIWQIQKNIMIINLIRKRLLATKVF